MNIQQFQYVVAVSELRHFGKAADKCFVTQSTLSTMISKFEDEIGIKIFDRKTKPVTITNEGVEIISQLKSVNYQISFLKEKIKELKGEIKGILKIGIIPTVAPFLLPLFLKDFALHFSQLEIEIKELTTSEIISQLEMRELDVGIASIPIKNKQLLETALYDEPFLWYDELRKASIKKLNIDTVNLSNFWLLEEGHCMRTQALRICNHQEINSLLNIRFKAGSIDSLIRFVKSNKGTTLLPFLATLNFSDKEKQKLITLDNPVPKRSIGLLVHECFVKKKILKNLKKEIQDKVSPLLPEPFSDSTIIEPI